MAVQKHLAKFRYDCSHITAATTTTTTTTTTTCIRKVVAKVQMRREHSMFVHNLNRRVRLRDLDIEIKMKP